MQTVYFLLIACTSCCMGLPIDGCPIWGCRPSGTFSVSMSVPKANATIDWVSDFFVGPVPVAGGCVGNSESVVCQSNGPGPGDTGFVGIDAESGEVRWRDLILRFPALPVMDTYGDIWGSDGSQVMSYDTDGKPMGQQIRLDPNLRPLFHVQVINENVLLLVSGNGQISMLLADGTPFASLTLRGTVERDNGTFIPTAPPVVNGNRFYVITEFAPDGVLSANLGLQRLYAIDTRQSMSDRVTIAWYANFEREASPHPSDDTLIYFRPSFQKAALLRRLKATTRNPTIMWDNLGQIVYVSLPPPILGASPKAITRFFGIKDNSNDSSLVFQSDRNVQNMFLYESNTREAKNLHQNPISMPNAGSQLWVSLPDGKLLALERNGNVSKVFNLPQMLQANFTITSKITTFRSREVDEDFLVFGIHVTSKTAAFESFVSSLAGPAAAQADYFLVGYDTPENLAMPVAWMLPTPENMPVTGQIVGAPSGGGSSKDRLIAFAQTTEAGKFFSVAVKS